MFKPITSQVVDTYIFHFTIETIIYGNKYKENSRDKITNVLLFYDIDDFLLWRTTQFIDNYLLIFTICLYFVQ